MVPCRHEPWPLVTLHRYDTMLQAERLLSHYDYIFYSDVDMAFVGRINAVEICGPGLTAVAHPGYRGTSSASLPYCRDSKSAAYLSPGTGVRYYAGGFQGGLSNTYLDAMAAMAEGIADDEARGVMATWHDESHWNRLLHYFPPSVVLVPQVFCCPQGRADSTTKIVALDKHHAAMRA